MNRPFSSPRMRIARAKEHIRNLDRRVARFFESKPYTRITEPDRDGTNDIHKIKLTRAFPEGVTSVAAEAIEGLRSALDHAAFATASLSGVKNSKSAYFPVSSSATELDSVIKGRCKDIPPDIIALFRSFKPYQGGNDLIWALNKACNTSKHGIVVPVGMAAESMQFSHLVMTGPASIPSPHWDSENNEIVFATTGPGAQFEYDLKFSFFVAFGEVDGIGGQPAVPVLSAIAGEVNRIVLAIEAEAKRLGLCK